MIIFENPVTVNQIAKEIIWEEKAVEVGSLLRWEAQKWRCDCDL